MPGGYSSYNGNASKLMEAKLGLLPSLNDKETDSET